MNQTPCRVLLVHSLPATDGNADPDFRIAPAGLFFIAGALRDKGYESVILPIRLPLFLGESDASRAYHRELKETIQQLAPDYVGYSFRNLYRFSPPDGGSRSLMDFFCVSQDIPVIRFIRTCVNAPVIGGGSAFSLAPEMYMTALNLDYGIQGEGEQPLVMLLDRLNRGLDPCDIPGLVYTKGESLIRNPGVRCGQDSWCAMDLSCLGDLKPLYYDHGGYGSVQTKRGCAFHCSYCVYPYLEGSVYRLRPVSLILDELDRYIHGHGMEHIYFVDSVFSNPESHSRAVVQAIIENTLRLRWYAYVNPINLTPDLLREYRLSGCAGLVLTLESGNDTILNALNKGFTVQDSVHAVKHLKASGIPFEVSMLIGSPGETAETLNDTLTFCHDHLRTVPVTFTPGVWMHPVSPVYSHHYKTNHSDVDALSRLILSNDFRHHNELHYLFSDQSTRQELIRMCFDAVDKEPRWFVIGKDMVPDAGAEIMRYPGMATMKRYARPWFSGLS